MTSFWPNMPLLHAGKSGTIPSTSSFSLEGANDAFPECGISQTNPGKSHSDFILDDLEFLADLKT